jgi:hypothetical protein
MRTPKPPQRKLQRWRLAHHSTLASRPDNEAVLSRAVHPEWRTGGAVLKAADCERAIRITINGGAITILTGPDTAYGTFFL